MVFAAMQRREVRCILSNGTVLEPVFCQETSRPQSKRECYNDECKGTWRVGNWSEVRPLGDDVTLSLRVARPTDGFIIAVHGVVRVRRHPDEDPAVRVARDEESGRECLSGSASSSGHETLQGSSLSRR